MKRSKNVIQYVLPQAFVGLLMLAGCATQGTHQIAQPDPAPAAAPERLVQPGDTVSVHYLCLLGSGEVAAATGAVPEDQPKSNIFMKQKDAGPVAVTAAGPDEPFTRGQDDPFETEILNTFKGKVAGMKEGEMRSVEVTAPDVPASDGQNYIVRLTRVRTRPREMKLTRDDFQKTTHKDPEVGQPFTMDPSFPGKVETVTEQDVVIRLYAKPGDIVKTPFGPGLIREEGPNYKVDIDARKGELIRAGSMVGRIADVDDGVITVDFRNPFGGETLLCDVIVEKITDEKLAQSGEQR